MIPPAERQLLHESIIEPVIHMDPGDVLNFQVEHEGRAHVLSYRPTGKVTVTYARVYTWANGPPSKHTPPLDLEVTTSPCLVKTPSTPARPS